MTRLSREATLRAYRQMRTIRDFEERVNVEIKNGLVPGFTHLYAGQEAVAVGICENLARTDTIISTHRGHGHCIAKGADITGMMKELLGSSEGLCKGKGGSMHIADFDIGILGANGIVAGGPPIAVGAALASKLKGDGGVSVSFSGDGSVNQGTCFEAMNLAVVLKVPKVFAIEDNGYSEHTGVSYAVGCSDLQARIAAFGMPVYPCDGLDFFSVLEASAKAIAHARSGAGPSAIYAVTQRFHGHFVGDPQGYRGRNELRDLRENACCLKNFRREATSRDLVCAEDLDAIDAAVATLIDSAVDAAKRAPRPVAADLLTDVYIRY